MEVLLGLALLREDLGVVACLHLLAAVDQALLRGWDAFLLFDALLYALNLDCNNRMSVLNEGGERC